MTFHDKFIESLSGFQSAGISCLTHIHALAILAREPEGIRMTDIAHAIKCRTATITGMMDTLEKMRMVVRVRTTNDRRSIIIQLTDQGQELLRALIS